MHTIILKDLPLTPAAATEDASHARALSHAEMKRVQGGRAIAVLVDGRPGGVVDDFQLEMAIFKGDIGVRVV